jgi:hypothetical protein
MVMKQTSRTCCIRRYHQNEFNGNRDDIHVESFKWSDDDKKIYFIAPLDGTLQLFEVNYPGKTKMGLLYDQITKEILM